MKRIRKPKDRRYGKAVAAYHDEQMDWEKVDCRSCHKPGNTHKHWSTNVRVGIGSSAGFSGSVTVDSTSVRFRGAVGAGAGQPAASVSLTYTQTGPHPRVSVSLPGGEPIQFYSTQPDNTRTGR